MEVPALFDTPDKSTAPNSALLGRKGEIQVIFGPMFSGKTTELLRRIRRYRYRNDCCLLLKTKDERYEDDYSKVVSHDNSNWLEAVACDLLYNELDQALRADVIGIDEGQFFPDLKAFCDDMANSGKIVIVAALDSDYRRDEFLGVCSLIAKAEKVSKLSSVCHLCKDDAAFTTRLTHETAQKVIGGADKYRPVCRGCYAALNKSSDH